MSNLLLQLRDTERCQKGVEREQIAHPTVPGYEKPLLPTQLINQSVWLRRRRHRQSLRKWANNRMCMTIVDTVQLKRKANKGHADV